MQLDFVLKKRDDTQGVGLVRFVNNRSSSPLDGTVNYLLFSLDVELAADIVVKINY